MDRLGGLSGTPRHRILTGRIRARTRDRQMIIWPPPRGRESASVKECDGRLGTPDKTPGDLFSSFGSPPPPLCVRARPAESSGCGRGRRACGRAAHTPSRPPTHLRIPRLRRLAARACHAPAPAADSRSDFGVAYCCRSFAEYRSSLQPSAGLKRAFARAIARALHAFIFEGDGQVLRKRNAALPYLTH